MHLSVTRFACSRTANQSFTAFVVATAAVINIDERIDGISRAMGRAITRDTGVVLTNQAVSTTIHAAVAMVDGAHGDFATIAIGCAIAEFALPLVAYQTIVTAVVAVATMFRLGHGIAQNAVTYRVAEATPTDARLTAGAFKAV